MQRLIYFFLFLIPQFYAQAQPSADVTVTESKTDGHKLIGSYTYIPNGELAEGTSVFQWYRGTILDDPDAVLIFSGAQTYSITSSDLGMYLAFEVTPVDESSNPGTPVRVYWGNAIDNAAPVATIAGISGTPHIGEKITVNYSVTDLENDPHSATIQWSHSDTEGGSYAPIGGVNSEEYVITAADKDKYLKAEVTPTATSGASPGITVFQTIQVANTAPIATISSISGTPHIGEKITVNYTVTDLEGDPHSATIQWSHSDTEGGSYTPIAGANSAEYTITAADKNKYLQAEVTPTATEGTSPGITVSQKIKVVNTAPIAEISSISGTPHIGEKITVNYTVTDLEGDPHSATIQWSHSDTEGSSYMPIEGANSAEYTITIEDKNKYLKAEVTPTATEGTSPGTTVSRTIQVANTAPIAEISSISGTAQIGEKLTVNYTVTDLENDPHGATIQWSHSDTEGGSYTPIAGANSAEYTITAADKNKYLQAEVTPTATEGTSPGITVSQTIKIANTAPIATITGISGTPHVGEKLTVNYTITDLEGDPYSATIQWSRSDTEGGSYTPIAGANSAEYTITIADKNKYLQAEVTPNATEGTSPGATVFRTIQVANGAVLAILIVWETVMPGDVPSVAVGVTS
ncbi:MAG TPA: hypothetical protein VHO72_07390, partial [Bacteroidales bacterium]|nr:hypothetical protein [Bacteroidales bacterium]